MSDERSWLERTFKTNLNTQSDVGCAIGFAIMAVGGGIGAVLMAIARAIWMRTG